MKAKEWWSNPDNAGAWLRRSFLYFKANPKPLIYIVDRIKDNFKSVLEVGAGAGTLIGKLSQEYPKVECSSLDINPKLSKHVKEKHEKVKTHIGDVIDLPFKDNSFELIFTHQVLQHICPEEIEQAISELERVASKEIWLFEGWGTGPDAYHGNMRHKGSGGTWYWDHKQFTYCYEVEHLEDSLNKQKKGGSRLYKIKV